MVVSYTTPSGYLQHIEDAMNRKDWFYAIVYSASIMERQCHIKIVDHLDDHKLNYNKKTVGDLYLSQQALLLLTCGVIDQHDYDIITKVNQARNNFIHRKEGPKYFIGTRANNEYSPLVNEALQILKDKLSVTRVYVSSKH